VTVDYDSIAPEYDRRYELHSYPGIRSAVRDIAAGLGQRTVLEVGCGTGAWLAELAAAGVVVAGAEPAAEMLRRAASRVQGDLRQASAEALPWANASFDVVLFINSLHHTKDPQLAFAEAFRVLRPGGTILSIGLDPHEGPARWYVYEYFAGTLEADLARFPSRAVRTAWLSKVGFVDISVHVVESLRLSMSLERALNEGALARSFTSQLTALTEDDYAAGLQRLRDAAAADGYFRLECDMDLFGTVASKPV
jgi:ubiquinone/menaquinone biosynthesis C-methylase UbiE